MNAAAASATGSYGDWYAVLWLLIIVLAWFSLAAMVAPMIGRALKRSRVERTRPVQPQRHRDAA